MSHPQPKPAKTRKQLKTRKDRAARLTAQQVRELVAARDGGCRYAQDTLIDAFCRGESEWAHFGKHKRARTRGQAPEKRHTTGGSLMLCTAHHQRYDAGTMPITATTRAGCDGRLIYGGEQ